MSPSRKVLIAAAVLALVAGIYDALQVGDPPPAGPPPRDSHGSSTRKSRLPERDSTSEKPTRDTSPTAGRQRELAKLKQLWLDLKPKGNDGVPEQTLLAKKSAALLLCGPEAVELLRFLKENKLWGESTLEGEIARLFDTTEAAEAREMLTKIADTKTWVDLRSSVSDGDSWRETWSRAAGKTCPDAEIDSFRNALGSPSCAQEALFGWSQRFAVAISCLSFQAGPARGCRFRDPGKASPGRSLPESGIARLV